MEDESKVGGRASAWLAGMVILALSPTVGAHGLQHETTRTDAVVVKFYYAGNAGKPWSDSYQVFAPGAEVAHQSGQVNADGEVSFRPNAPGKWRVRVVTGDGHGAHVSVVVDEAGALPDPKPGAGYAQRIITAFAWLFGIFGLAIVVRDARRKRT